jgi:hypothetical protein
MRANTKQEEREKTMLEVRKQPVDAAELAQIVRGYLMHYGCVARSYPRVETFT